MLHQMPFMKTQENLNKNVNENRFYTNIHASVILLFLFGFFHEIFAKM